MSHIECCFRIGVRNVSTFLNAKVTFSVVKTSNANQLVMIIFSPRQKTLGQHALSILNVREIICVVRPREELI